MPVIPTAVIRAKAVDWKQENIAATPDRHILVSGDLRIASSSRMDGMDLQTVIFLLYGGMSVESYQRKIVIPGKPGYP